jgi:dienelactone hydrolase
MKERAYLFGETGNLLGILSEPDPPTQRPTVLLLNAGLVHRVGPFRMNVDLARRLAVAGFPAFRLDISGLGDSGPRLGELEMQDRALIDAQEAMDFLAQRTGARRFIAAGLCAGALHAHGVAVSDPRVVGAVLLDGYAYPSLRFLLHRYGPRLASPSAILGFARRRWSAFQGHPPARVVKEDILDLTFPPQVQVGDDLRQLMERDVQLLFVYSGNWHPYFNYREQLRDNFPDVPFGSRLAVEHFPDADHTYTLLEDRERLFGRVVAWARAKFS